MDEHKELEKTFHPVLVQKAFGSEYYWLWILKYTHVKDENLFWIHAPFYIFKYSKPYESFVIYIYRWSIFPSISMKKDKGTANTNFLTIWKVEKRVIVAVNNIIMVDIKTMHKRKSTLRGVIVKLLLGTLSNSKVSKKLYGSPNAFKIKKWGCKWQSTFVTIG